MHRHCGFIFCGKSRTVTHSPEVQVLACFQVCQSQGQVASRRVATAIPGLATWNTNANSTQTSAQMSSSTSAWKRFVNKLFSIWVTTSGPGLKLVVILESVTVRDKYSLSHLRCHFLKLFPKLEAQGRISFAKFKWKETYELWLWALVSSFASDTASGIGCAKALLCRVSSFLHAQRQGKIPFFAFCAIRGRDLKML